MSQTSLQPKEPRNDGPSRRNILSVSAGSVALPLILAQGASQAEAAPPAPADPRGGARVDLTVNGRSHVLAIDPRSSLLDTLRDQMGLTGSKKGCDHGQCGACTVLIGGKRVLSCLTLAVAVREPVVTIEGLAGSVGSSDGALHPMQQAFIDHDAFQCGYCTPGQILSAVACIEEGHAGSDAEIREYMSGNLCRCAAYPHIVDAVNQAKGQMKSSAKEA